MKEIKLCDGFKMCITNPMEYTETEDWQEIREKLNLDVDSQEWTDITRCVFALGYCEFSMVSSNYTRNVRIEVIPCYDR